MVLALAVLLPACSFRVAGNKYDVGVPRRDALTEAKIVSGDITATFRHNGPFPLWVEPRLVMDVERDGDKVKVHIETSTKSKESAGLFGNVIPAFFGFLGGLFVAK